MYFLLFKKKKLSRTSQALWVIVYVSECRCHCQTYLQTSVFLSGTRKKYLDNQNILLNMYVVVSDMHYIRCYSEVPGWIVSCTEQELNMGLRIMDCFEFQSFYKLDGMTEYSGLHLKKSCT